MEKLYSSKTLLEMADVGTLTLGPTSLDPPLLLIQADQHPDHIFCIMMQKAHGLSAFWPTKFGPVVRVLK